MRSISLKHKVVVAGVVAATLGASGVAYAYWTTGGSGTGAAATAAGADNQLSVSGDVKNAMFPGDTAQTVTAVVTNNGSANYKVQTLKAYLTIDATHATAGCTSADYKLNDAAAPGTSGTAADLSVTATDLAPGHTVSKEFAMQFNDLATNQDFCKGAVVTINYVAS